MAARMNGRAQPCSVINYHVIAQEKGSETKRPGTGSIVTRWARCAFVSGGLRSLLTVR
jgi:hypothetical protein